MRTVSLLLQARDDQDILLFRYGFYYDSSMPTESPSWPYSLEYRMPHSCSVKPCPSESHPGMWEVPMKTLKDVRSV